MYWGLYQTLLVFAGASTLALLLARRSVVPLGLFSGGVWAVLALQARNIEILREVADPPLVTGSVAWQFLATGLSLLCLSAAFLYFLGVFPPEDDAAQPAADMAETGDSNFDT
jgi:hypothetical protein